MSRSNPNADIRTPNPAERFFEWKGGDGTLQYFDKVKKENVEMKTPFTFILLDQLNTIGGYNKKLKTGLFSNEVRDIQTERLTVKFFDGGKVAEGFYADIKDTIVAKSGHFCKACYIAFKDGKDFKLGLIKMQGCSLGPWFEFAKENGGALYKQAVVLGKGELNDEGEITFHPPVFGLKDVSPETDEIAKQIDAKLQEYLKGYFSRTLGERVAPAGDDEPPVESRAKHEPEPEKDSSVPF